MLQIIIPAQELWNEKENKFIDTSEYKLTLEHSLVSLSKWESKYKKPFLDNKTKTPEETLDYIRMMTITQNIPHDAYNYLTKQNIQDITNYIQDTMTATWFSEDKNGPKGRSQIFTSELIYGYMVVLQIPWEAQKWHLNRLLTLIRVCNNLNQPPKKKKGSEVAKDYKALNAARLKSLGTRG